MEEELVAVRGTKFRNEAVNVDGIEFIDCSFTDCDLLYSGGGLFAFTNSPGVRCTMVFVGAAENTLHALGSLYATGMHDFVESLFTKIRNPFDDPIN